MLWGTAEHLASLFGPHVRWTHTPEIFTFRFPPPDAFVAYFAEHYGPTLKAVAAAGDRAEELQSDLTELVRTWNRLDQDGPVAIPATYLTSVGVRAPKVTAG